jgi:hypothetical protein
MNLTNSFKMLSNEIEDVHQTNLKPIVIMDSSRRGAPFYVEHMIKQIMAMLTRTSRQIGICTFQYRREMKTNFSMTIEQKTYNTKVVWNSVARLLPKGNFKRRTVCDKFDKNWSNRFQTKLKVTPNKTRNGYRMD